MDFPLWPRSSKGDFQEFLGVGTTTWQTWTKPRGVDMALIFCIGAGASGGGGLTGGPGTSRGGGGGGGGGGVTRLLVRAFWWPERLYIHVGLVGAAVGAGPLGNSGG